MIQLLFNFMKKKNDKKEFTNLSEEDESENIRYSDEIERLRALQESPETVLEVIDALARDFLRKKFHIRRNAEYTEIADFFAQKNKPYIATFCKKITEALYSGEKITVDLVEDLTADLENIINKEGLGEELGPKEDILSSMVNKIKILDYGEKQEKKDDYVGKNTRKIIKTKILGKKRPSLEKLDSSAIIEKPDILKENSNGGTALSFLQDISPEAQEEKEKNIASIDDLDRIRNSIQRRKRIAETANSS